MKSKTHLIARIEEKYHLTKGFVFILVWFCSSFGQIIFPSAQFVTRKGNGMGNAISDGQNVSLGYSKMCHLVTPNCEVTQSQLGEAKAFPQRKQ